MYQRVSVIGVGITTVKQACQNLSLAAPLVFLGTSRHYQQVFFKTARRYKGDDAETIPTSKLWTFSHVPGSAWLEWR